MERQTTIYPTMGSSPQPQASSPSPQPSTTFVQADANTFRELVQRLTGADEATPDKLPVTLPARFTSKTLNPSGDVVGPRRSSFKLQERRQNIRKLEIQLGRTSIRNPPSPNSSFSPRNKTLYHHHHHHHLVVSPIPSPVTPLTSDSFFSSCHFQGSGSSSPAASEEEKAIAEKGFYLHPSPLSTPRGSEPPELLPLFPLSSPKQQQQQSRDP